MSLLDKASLVITPNGVKAGKLYSVIPNAPIGDMDVVRATTATRVNSLGLIESVGLNVPRLDYTNGINPSILVEPQRTNILLNSEIVVTQTIATTALKCAVSFYGTGTITFSGTFVGSLIGTGVNNRVTLVFTPTSGSLILTVSGSVTKGQLETGSFATSYIPTVASTVTRNADLISKTGISSLIGQTEGTIFSDFNITNNDLSNNKVILSIDDISYYVNFISVRILSNNFFNVTFRANSLPITFSNLPLATNGNHKLALKYGNGFVSIFINGVLRNTQPWTNSFTSSISRLLMGKDHNEPNIFNDRINSIQLYKTALTDAECIQLTTL